MYLKTQSQAGNSIPIVRITKDDGNRLARVTAGQGYSLSQGFKLELKRIEL